MKKFLLYLAIAATATIDIAIVVTFHRWCESASRGSILWCQGAFNAYAQAYLYAFILCCMASMPLIFVWDELKK